jgi:predicted dehydrogenase
MRIKVGIAGYGKMGKIRAHTIDNYPDMELTHVFDPNITEIDRREVVLVKSYKELLNADIDAVFICAYAKQAAEYTCAALNAGLHVFCEKPPAMQSEELNFVRSCLENSGKILKYGFNHRHHYSVMEAKKLIESGKIGRILFMRGIYGKAGSLDFEKNWRNYKDFSGGGILMDQGIHMLDLFMYLTNDCFRCIGASVKTAHWDIEYEDNVMALLENKDGVVASLHSSATQWRHKFSLEILGSTGYINLDGILSSTMSYAPEKILVGKHSDENTEISMGRPVESTYTYEKDNSWNFELQEFIDAINGKSPISNGSLADSVNLMRIIEEVYEKGRI